MNDDELLQAIAESAKRGKQAAGVPALDEVTRARIAKSIATSLPRKRNRVALASTGAGVLALAAALLLFMRHPADDLPAYDVVVLGGAREVRGVDTPNTKESAPLRLRHGDRFEIQLTPAHATQGALAGRAFLTRGPTTIPFRGAVELAPEGGARVAGTLDDFPGVTPGASELVVVLGRPNEIPEATADTSSLTPAPGRTVHRVQVIVE
jgi:hypothetical protein